MSSAGRASRRASRLRDALVVLGSLVAGLALIEGVVFPVYLPIMPTNMLSMTEWYGRQLGQSSKNGVIARDYILLTGDSYAEGAGDGFLSAGSARAAHGSAHVIAERLGRDVLSVGRGGSSSVTAALEPRHFARQARMSLLYPIAPPSAIAYYFYEGNDLNDNLFWAKTARGADFTARRYSPAEIAALIADEAAAASGPLASAWRFAQANFPGTLFMARALGLNQGGVFRRFFADGASTAPAGGVNKAVIDGAVVALPDRLQSPALDLPDTAWANSVLTLRKSLEALAAANSGVPIAVVYLPSPLSSYDLASRDVSYQVYGQVEGANLGLASAAQVAANLSRLRAEVCEIARDLGFAFADPTPQIRSAARRRPLHGPLDWKHFNLEGYRIIGEAVADALAPGGPQGRPRTCAPIPP